MTPGRNAVDAHAARSQLLGQRAGQADDGGFAGGIGDFARCADAPPHAGDGDNRAFVSGDHARRKRANKVKHAGDVYIHDRAPLFIRHIAEKPGMRNARAQHQRVHAMIQGENVAAHGLRAFAVGQIAADGVRVAALGAETIRQRFGVLKP